MTYNFTRTVHTLRPSTRNVHRNLMSAHLVYIGAVKANTFLRRKNKFLSPLSTFIVPSKWLCLSDTHITPLRICDFCEKRSREVRNPLLQFLMKKPVTRLWVTGNLHLHIKKWSNFSYHRNLLLNNLKLAVNTFPATHNTFIQYAQYILSSTQAQCIRLEFRRAH
jgi:hypothetical protein